MQKKHPRQQLFIWLLLAMLSLSSSCAYLSGPSCISCYGEKKDWSSFSFLALEGTWQGTEELQHKGGLALSKQEKEVELSFLSGKKFLRLYNFSSQKCNFFPEESIVILRDIQKSEKIQSQAFEVFGRTEKNHISFGKVYIYQSEKNNTIDFSCHYTKITELNKNRLSLPSLNYSFIEKNDPKRRISSNKEEAKYPITTETVIRFDFFRFEKSNLNKKAKNRKIAAEDKSLPPLFFQILSSTYKITENYGKKSWLGTRKRVFKLWPLKE